MNFFQDLKDKLGKGFEQAGNKSQRVFEVSRLTLKVKSKQEDLDDLVERLGWIVYETWEENKEWKETEEIKKALKAVYELDQEIKSLQKELDRLKNSNITQRIKAETVELPVATVDENEEVKKLSNSIYLCSYCAYQVTESSQKCGNCNRQFY